MQIIELYIKGYKRINGSVSSIATDKLIDSTAQFTIFAEVGDIVTNITTGLTATITAIDSDTQVTLDDDIFKTTTPASFPQYLLTSDYFRADLFKDESVSITDSILNIKDVAKIFTPFSQQFNLPASKTNNKLFRHYENQDVLNSFDARYRHDAIIKLNGIDYKKGKIQFKSVDLKNNAAYAYKIVFFGETVELKEILGDTKLSGLIYESSLNFEYTDANITSMLEADSGVGGDDVIVANIHHTRNMRIDEEGNYKDFATGQLLQWTDVKPAIKCRAVIDAIRNTYPQINIKGFLNSSYFDALYMWMHKNEGYITNAEEGGNSFIVTNRFFRRDGGLFSAAAADWEFLSSSPTSVGDIRTVVFPSTPTWINSRIKFDLTVNVGSSTIPYTVRLINGQTNTVFGDEVVLSGNANVYRYFDRNDFAGDFLDVIVEIEAENTISLSQTLVLTMEKRPSIVNNFAFAYSATYEPTASNTDVDNTFYIAQQMPDMKVIDWLSGLFKMFNLVVYKDYLGDIMTQRAPFWSNIGVAYDITKYVDMSKSTVERLFQYKEMEFKFKSKKSFLVQFSDDIQNTEFSQEMYPNGGLSNFDGGVYKVELPFEKMMYERLTDPTTGSRTAIQQGAMLDRKFAPTIGAPLLFCPELQENTGGYFNITQSNGNAFQPNYYNKPTHLFPFPPYAAPNGRSSLNFGIEADEWTGVSPGSSNLFSDGYLDYTQTIFDINARMLKVSAYLPLSIITKYQMNDTFVINNKPYRINSIKTNLLTNKTDLELYNKSEFVSQVENGEVAFLGRLASVDITSTASTITISYTPLSDPVANDITGYSIYLNGENFTDLATDVSGTTLFSLPSNTSYEVEVKVKYNINSVIRYSFGVGQTITTTL
tara:strand:- start:1903 stop:4539 length:2637 start_codon:yes stop_codon:yes gene_type:complete